jgi:hypothetical protein
MNVQTKLLVIRGIDIALLMAWLNTEQRRR